MLEINYHSYKDTCSCLCWYYFTFSVLTITAAYEDALQIFSECLPKIGEVNTVVLLVCLHRPSAAESYY